MVEGFLRRPCERRLLRVGADDPENSDGVREVEGG